MEISDQDAIQTETEFVSMEDIRKQLERPGANPAVILRAVVQSPKYATFATHLQTDLNDCQEFIEMLDRTIDSTHMDTDLFQEFRRLCGRTGLLPSSHTLLSRLRKSGDQPTASGGFGDVWKGECDGRPVAIKALRLYSTNNIDSIKKKFCKEVVMWRRLSHPNIVPFLGVSTSIFQLAMISEWMPQGNLRQYVKENPETDRLKLLMDITEGLNYLHRSSVVHGDLKGDNVLINEDDRACLCDFGFTSLALTLNSATSISRTRGSIRWMAPELFDTQHEGPEITRPTQPSDIYAFGMVFIEVFTAQTPFNSFRQDHKVIFQIIKGMRPERPPHTLQLGLSDTLWQLTQDCWDADRAKRPSAASVLERLQREDPEVSLLPLTHGFDPASKESIRTLRFALSSRDDVLLQLHGLEAHAFIDVLDQAMNSVHSDEEMSRKCLRALKRLCGRTGFLPSSYTIPEGRLTKTKDLPVASGTYSDVWEGMLDKDCVRIKSLRIKLVVDLGRVKTRFCSEAVIWKRLKHPNIVPFLGISTHLEPLCMVSPWLANGHIVEYVNLHDDADRVLLLVHIVQGLEHLHSFGIVHGNLKGTNVLINDSGVACITDFGIAAIANETLNDFTADAGTYLSVRWMAPEILDHENGGSDNSRPSKGSDIYSFAMLAIEVFTGKDPFHGYRKEGVILQVIHGKRPNRPENSLDVGLSDTVWNLIQLCWTQEREERPTTSCVLRSLCRAANLTAPTPTIQFSTFQHLGPRDDALSASTYKSLGPDDRDESELSKSFARTGNNFGPTREKTTRGSNSIFRSIQAFFSEPSELEEESTWPTIAPFSTVDERPSAVGVRNDVIPSIVSSRPIKARRAGKRTMRIIPSLNRPLLGENLIGSLAGDDEAHDPSTSEVSQARWPGEVVRDVELEAEDTFSRGPPPSEQDSFQDVNEELSFGGYAQW